MARTKSDESRRRKADAAVSIDIDSDEESVREKSAKRPRPTRPTLLFTLAKSSEIQSKIRNIVIDDAICISNATFFAGCAMSAKKESSSQLFVVSNEVIEGRTFSGLHVDMLGTEVDVPVFARYETHTTDTMTFELIL